jgi:PAS domain S-box-containing protein
MTEDANKERLLRESDDLFRLILENVDDLIAVLDTQGTRIYNSPGYYRILKDNTAGDSFAHVHPEDRSRIKSLFRQVVNTGSGGRTEYRYLTGDGSIRYIESQSSVVKNDAGQVINVLVVSRDITERKLAEQAMRAAKEAAEAALERAVLAERRIISISEETRERIGQELHDDLGQHLTGVAFLSEVLNKQLSAKNWPEMQSVTRITTLINEAVARTRQLAQGLYPVELKEAGLQAMLGQLAYQLKSIYGVECEVVYDENFVAANSSLAINLFRIAQEAANNAIKHGSATKISITISLTADNCVFEITDNGCGIDLSKHGGLGMHTMRYRATLIGATFSCEPMASGGTRVTVRFPA